MKKKYLYLIITSIIVITSGWVTTPSTFAQKANYVNGIKEGRVIVKFKNNKTIKSQASRAASRRNYAPGERLEIQNAPELQRISSQLKVTRMEPLFVMNPKFEQRFKKEELDLWYAIDYEAKESPLAVVEALKTSEGIEIIEPDPELTLPEYKVIMASPNSRRVSLKETHPVNDPYYPEQWHYHNTGQVPGIEGADINLEEAWKKRMDASSVIVAVMDQGVDYAHEDLRDNIWVNEIEAAGFPNVDDDGNGLIDDIYGFDFGNGYAQIEKGNHGTHVAGTVAAVNNNGIGVAGVAGGSGSGNGARIMTLPVFGSNNTRVANCYVYAADNGALISQNSWGYSTPGVYSEAFETGIRYFEKYAGCDNNGNQLPGSLMKGGVVIFASGNYDMEGDFFPSNLEEVIAVSALSPDNTAAPYTNYDTWVDVSSYGGNMDIKTEAGVLSTLPGNQYGYMDGTSMACPHVSGMAALSLAELGGPGFTNQMLRNYIVLTTRDNEKNYTAKHKNKMGSGIVDALRVMTKNDGLPPNQITDASISVISDQYMCITFSAPSKSDGSAVEGYRVYVTETSSGVKDTYTFKEDETPGYKHSFTISNLKGNTSYSAQVTSYDIWSVESEPSAALSFVTSATKGNLTYSGLTTRRKTADFDQEKQWEFEIEISNNSTEEDKGGLFWRADGYNKSHSNEVVSPLSVKKGSDGLASTPFNVATDNYIKTLATEQGVYQQAGFVSYLTNRTELYPATYIGEVKENGIMYTSSAAQKFTVPKSYEKGFSLTHFDIGLRTADFWLYDDQVNNPENLTIAFEVYRGGDKPLLENRIYKGEILNQKDQLITLFELPYHPYFKPEESFWIVAHADKRYKYPLGINGGGVRAENSYYSSDHGKNWTVLSKVYNAVESPVFTIAALSKKYDTESFLTISPSSGFLGKGKTQKIKAIVDFKNIPEGKDTSLIVFNTDGTITANRNNLTSILTLTRKDIQLSFSEDCYENGMVSLGDISTSKVVVRNNGMGHMAIEQITLDNTTDFRLVSEKPDIIASNDSVILEVEFKPTALGAKSSELKINGRGVSVSTIIIGTCVEAPQALITPKDITLPVVGNEVQEISFQIQNQSNYALNYQIPQFLKTDEVKRIKETQEKPSYERTDTIDLKAGYTWVDNRMGKSYKGSVWNEISETGIELTPLCDGLKKYHKIKLPFIFRYYDRLVKEVYVGINGMIRLDTTSHYMNVPAELPILSEDPDTPEAFTGIIAPFWIMDGTSGHFRNTRFYYQFFDDCILFQFTGTQAWLSDMSSTDCQLALYPDGSFEFRIKKAFDYIGPLSNNYMVGWSSPDGTDGKSVHFFSKTLMNEINRDESSLYCIKVFPPKFSPFQAIEDIKYKGVVGPRGSKEIKFKIDPKDLEAGNSQFDMSINTNDPLNKETSVHINIVKTDQLLVNFLNQEENYGQFIFEDSSIEKQFGLFNLSKTDGKIRLRLSNQSNIHFQDNLESVVVDIQKQRLKMISLFLKGDVDAMIFAETEDGKICFDTLQVTASNLNYHNINQSILDKKELVFDMTETSTVSHRLKVTADDKAYKSKVFVPGFLKVKKADEQPTTQSTLSQDIDMSGYRWFESSDPKAPQFIWNDISKTGTRLYLGENVEYNGHDLPFKFPFYGEEYSKLYISANGRISPFPLGWDVMYSFVPPLRMPDASLPVPMIAAMWTRQWYESLNKEAGIYYQIEEDRMIVQYHQFMYDWVITNGYCSYQVILYADGKIQFVYLDIDNCDLKDNVTIGLQGKGYSKEQGYTYTLTGSTPIKSRTTITAKPMYGPFSVMPGETIELEMIADNYSFKTGTYEDKAVFISDNNQLLDEIPISMIVTSNAKIGYRETELDFGTIITGNEIAPKVATLINSGNEDIEVTKLHFQGDDADMFSVKRMISVIDMGLITTKYEEITYPFTIKAFDNESFAVFVTPKSESRLCTSDLVCESSANQSIIPVKMNSVKPAEISVETSEGKNEINLDLSGKKSDYKESYFVNYKEGVNKQDINWELKVLNEPLPQPQYIRSNQKPLTHVPFGTVAVKQEPFPGNLATTIKPMAVSSESIEPFDAISVIKDTPPVAMMGTQSMGEHYGLSCFVKMTTGDNGFLMSHLRMWTNTIGRDTSAVTIRIYNDCERPNRDHLIYEKEHRLKMNVELVGDLILPLEHNIAFAPKQEFWVEVYFGVKLQMPMAVADIPEGVTDNRNFYQIYNAQTEKWNEIQPYPAYFAIWAIQESYSDLTQWLRPSLSKDSIIPQEIVPGEIVVNPLHLPIGSMTMELTAKTNELSNIVPLRINAHKFTEPEWVEFPDKPIIVKEGESISFKVKAVDPEGLPVTYRLKSPVEGVTLTTQADGSLNIDYRAPYLSSFVSNLNIEARTEKGLSERRISLANINVNRPPVAMDVKPITLNINAMAPVVLPLYYFFVDPDLDALQYSANTSSSGVGLQLNENGFIFTPIHEDVVDITLTAFDGEFTATTRFIVNVIRPLNNPPTLIKPFHNMKMATGGGLEIDLSEHFIDQDGDSLTYEAWAVDPEVANASIEGCMLSIATFKPGISAIAIKVKDIHNSETLASFAIKAEGEIEPETASNQSNVIMLAPNPTRIESRITYSDFSDNSIETFCEIRDGFGRLVYHSAMPRYNQSGYETLFKVGDLTPGIYFVSIIQDSKVVSTEKLIIER